jgi:CelD/BcsL family acetyltransferase involved in cellulose biosynthesis
MEIGTAAKLDGLAADALALLDRPPGLFSGRAWWDVVLANALPGDAEACFVTIRTGDAIVALVPMLRQRGRLASLTTPYTCAYAPLFAAEADGGTRIAAMAALARFCRDSAVTRLDAMPAEWEGLPDLLAGARRAGLYPLVFHHFGNWHEEVAGLDWSAYLRARPGALRETIRRRLRRAEALPEARFTLLTQPAEMDRAADAFESVYRRSWKQPEPYPAFNVALMRTMAARGVLRFGLWSMASEPVAVQLWVVMDRRAIVLKLAHDEAFKAHSPGTVLTALMLRHLLDREQVTEIDFGRGDDAYKQGWASRRRQRIGVLLVNPWRPAGAYALLRHVGGWVLGALRNRGRQRTPIGR